MTVEETYLSGCFIISPKVFKDQRGYFFESFNQREFKALTGIDISFVQDNQSQSDRGVLRGLHYQTGEHAQAKLVRVIQGSVLDVCVDLRPNSKTFKKSFSIILNGEDNNQLFVPRGFAHGFLVLEDKTIFSYKCDNFYNKSAESGIIYNDPTLNINWNFPNKDLILSEKDEQLESFETLFK
ncbi:MAG: dTDP-4-dehydrorhamnose 3,5-epimerase [Bacteroidia bacterium]|nr:dTDP-4-dehydrorhamnose 3,5-epimerase [Bacteroidia bacterium]NND25732.1 dTDP-4-dehydrorhamnose 3,5-epimerase [Flavobacteriaceae bacterium]MBT8278667.1 dTDP-4-dehydrorhamnose 3,5-epimerase [Bacteroidia bacterium]NNK59738.1 dTDP-4-dehydrorhamnose 3,5-epimerase [Flavobacteriaceae bacterium]NNL33441.1 dTDP-4-dehydrorhamnose 3,5-epimerase [Flavobacteriaceae bacterium]